ALDPANKPAQEARVWQVIEDTGAELVGEALVNGQKVVVVITVDRRPRQ
ncbi:hypothetical protein GHO31_24740, partial [Pseudomonas sp. FSL R10-2172]|nr:hypothetical protein [Pseudomonas sp. FSL R10-2172]